MKCATCYRPLVDGDDVPEPTRWCSSPCADAALRREDGWIRVDALSLFQRAELDTLLGLGRPT
jgi:hypothetical protein